MPQITQKFHGKVVNGRIMYAPTSALRREAWLRNMDGQEIEEVLRKPVKVRSDNQRRYYWGVVVKMLAEVAGYTPEEMHEALKWEFLRVYGDGLRLPTVRSTEALSTAEGEEYVEKCRRLGAQMYDCCIPLPNEVEEDKNA